jgi:hypothetical protein
MNFVIMLLIFFLIIFFFIWPLQIAARMIEAKRSGFGSCFLAILAANVLSTIVFAALPQLMVFAVLVNVLITAFVFAGVLGTTFIKAVAITLVYWILMFALVFVGFFIASILGIALTIPFT